jgi:hypothetical protein
MKSKYLIGVIPSIFILMIACFAKAEPVAENLGFDSESTLCYETVTPIKVTDTLSL